MECKHCHSTNTIKRGGYGKEGHRYKCKSCKTTFTTLGVRKRYSFQDKQRIVNLSRGYSNLTRISKVYRISKNTIYKWRGEIIKYNTILQAKMGYY